MSQFIFRYRPHCVVLNLLSNAYHHEHYFSRYLRDCQDWHVPHMILECLRAPRHFTDQLSEVLSRNPNVSDFSET